MSDDRKDLPPVSAPNFNERLRETISTYLGNRGNKLDRGLTLRDLVEANIIKLRNGYLAGSGGIPVDGLGTAVAGPYAIDRTPPPTPSGFAVNAAISNIFIECDAPLYTQGHGHARTVVYGATWTTGALPVFGDAVQITEFTGTVFAHPTNPATTWHLWIKWVTVDGVESSSPAGGTNGMMARTAVDARKLVEAMTGPGNPFKIVTAPITLADGTLVPVGTYTSDAYMASFVAARGQIGLLAVDDARIASLKVSKLEGESLKVGAYISSSNYIAGAQGFRINADGLAEFSNAVVRGTVYATNGTFAGELKAATGTFSGELKAATGTFSGNISAASGNFRGGVMGGAFTGYAWPANGAGGGFYLGSGGLLLGNANRYFSGGGGGYFLVDETGDIRTPSFDVINGKMTVKQLDVIDTFNIRDNAISYVTYAQVSSATITVHGPSSIFLVGKGVMETTGNCGLSLTVAGRSIDYSAAGGGGNAIAVPLTCSGVYYVPKGITQLAVAIVPSGTYTNFTSPTISVIEVLR